MSEGKACMATPCKDLEQRIMDSSVAKSEAEWWAKHKIEELRTALAEKEEEIAFLHRTITETQDIGLLGRIKELEEFIEDLGPDAN